jgi:hypothetical protein
MSFYDNSLYCDLATSLERNLGVVKHPSETYECSAGQKAQYISEPHSIGDEHLSTVTSPGCTANHHYR